MTVDLGTVLNGRYQLVERIATGGMGEVWRARDEVLGRDVAVKTLKREYADDPLFLDRFRAEARHAAGLVHQNIASVFDYGEADGVSYLVMELVKGDPLSAILAADGRLSPDRALSIVAQAARGLEAAHAGGVIHRDVKPGNIIVCPDGTVKLTDFGIARATDAVPLTQTGMVMGTAHYISPEQANGAPVSFASDVYSLGVVAYECLAGERPFQADTPIGIAMAHLTEDPRPLPPDVPPAIAGLVTKAMAKAPEDRYPSAAAFAQAADAARAELGHGTEAPATAAMPASTMVLPAVDEAPPTATTAATAATAAGPVAAARSRRPLIAAVAVVAAVIVLAVLIGNALQGPPAARVPQLRGLTRAEAVAALDKAGLDPVEKRAYSDTVRSGVVIRQDPAPGETLRAGDDVTVTISRGAQPVRLPGNLIGRPVDDVVRDLQSLDLKVVRLGERVDRPFGTVTSVSPTSGLHKGDTVTVRYSLGEEKDDGEGKGDGKGGKGKDD